jgi:hypothetical protein
MAQSLEKGLKVAFLVEDFTPTIAPVDNVVADSAPAALAVRGVRNKLLGQGRNVYINVPVPFSGPKDEVFSDRFLIRYYPGDAGDYAAVDPLDNSWAELGGLPSHSMNPLNPFGNPRELRYLELHDFESPDDPKHFSVELHPLDKDHMDVILRREGTWKQYRRIGVWTGATPPVVTAIDEVHTDPKGKVYESRHRLSDFKRCPGGMVARQVRAVFSGGDGKVRVQEWRSRDLGNVQPTKNDFVVILTPRTSIHNLKDPPAPDAQPRVLDVTLLTDAELGMPIRRR